MIINLVSKTNSWFSIIPAIIITVFLLLIPWLFVFIESFSNGISGYINIFSDSQFGNSLLLSIEYTLITVIFQILLGTIAAVLVYDNGINTKMLTVALFAPYAIPTIVTVVSWGFLIEDMGLYAYFMNVVFRIPATMWKNELAFLSLCILSIWQFYPFVFISVLAQLRRINPNLYKIAQIDGANFWEQFKIVIFPSIRSTLFAILIVRIAFMFTKFDVAWLFAGKTVVSGVQVLPIYVYNTNSSIGNRSDGAAAAILSALFLAILIVIVFYFKLLLKKIKV